MNEFAKILFILILILVFIIIYKLIYDQPEHMINISKIDKPKWHRNKCQFLMNETLEKVLKDYNIIKSDENSSAIIFPCSYDELDDEIKLFNPKNKDQRFFVIDNADSIIAKEELWKNVVNYHGLEKAKIMLPVTYVLNNDIDNLKKEFTKDKLYILKKNIQRQEGLKITDSLDEILNAKKDGYVVVQELLTDPYVINKRKINMRFYVLVLCQDNNVDVYVYHNGFMYYTKDEFTKFSKDPGPNITTGYIDRWVYTVNPLTHEDFAKYLDDKSRKLTTSEQDIIDRKLLLSNVIFTRIYDLIKNVFLSYIGKICGGVKLRSNISFQLFGVDVAINDKLWPMIMEINKGPDMGSKDERDGAVKYSCIADILRIIGVINDDHKNGFIKLFEVDNGQIK